MRTFKDCEEAAAVLSTETSVKLARRWQERNGWPKRVTLERCTAMAVWDIVLGRDVLKSLREEVRDALDAVRVARMMRGEA